MDKNAGAPSSVALLRETEVIRIYEAEDPRGQKIVVKQLVDGAATSDPWSIRRFEREAQLASVLKHPGLARFAGKGPGWFAIEHLEPALGLQNVRGFGGSSKEVASLLLQLAATLAYVHACGIAHRDVKPANILFRDGSPVLIDFGVAGLLAEDPLADREISGSPAWMAPEQVLGQDTGARADIWSWAAIGIWLSTGRKPYDGTADTVLKERSAGKGPDFDWLALKSAVPAELFDILKQSLGKPDHRPTAAEIVRRLLPVSASKTAPTIREDA